MTTTADIIEQFRKLSDTEKLELYGLLSVEFPDHFPLRDLPSIDEQMEDLRRLNDESNHLSTEEMIQWLNRDRVVAA